MCGGGGGGGQEAHLPVYILKESKESFAHITTSLCADFIEVGYLMRCSKLEWTHCVPYISASI